MRRPARYRGPGRLAPTSRVALACLALVAFAAVGSASRAQEDGQDFRVIVNTRNPIGALPKTEISKLLLRQLSKWQDGTEAHPVDLPESSPIREAFNREIHGRKGQAISSYWQRQIFSANQVPPPTLSTDAEIVAYVRNEPGAIGYVSADASLGGVRVIEVVDR